MPQRRRRVDRVVFFPRYTAFVGTTALYTAPLDARAYAEVDLLGWQGTGLGGTPASVSFTLQHSADLENWVDETAFSPTAGSEAMNNYHLAYAWVRAKAAVTGADPGVVCWLTGELVYREGPAAGEAP